MGINIQESLKDIRTKDEFWKFFENISRKYEGSLDTAKRKSNGVYYTGIKLAYHMVEELLDSIDHENIQNKTFLEPCVGLGVFVFAYIEKVSVFKQFKDIENVKTLLGNIYANDINQESLELYSLLFQKFAQVVFNYDIDLKDININGGLVFNLGLGKAEYLDINNYYPEILKSGGFDIIITNPPYKNLKVEKNKYSNEKDLESDKQLYLEISQISKSLYKYTNVGVLNIYKLFVEDILTKYSKSSGLVSLLIPTSILTDKTCEKIRKYTLINHSIDKINVVAEGAGYVDAQQALSSLLIRKGTKTSKIRINNNFNESTKDKYAIMDISKLSLDKTGFAIFSLNQYEYNILEQLQRYPTVKELDYIKNLRGELDLTFHKEYIFEGKGKLPLLRGRNIGYYKVISADSENVSKDFLSVSTKSSHVNLQRIACQQIANMSKDRRLTFTLVEPGFVLANSCNYLFVESNSDNLDIYSLLGLMNSRLMNWLFKVTSSNNHINNYELDMLPIPNNKSGLKKLSSLVQKYLLEKDKSILNEIDSYVDKLYDINFDNTNKKLPKDKLLDSFIEDISALNYGLNIDKELVSKVFDGKLSTEILIDSFIVDKKSFEGKVIIGLIEKYLKLKNSEILNHTSFKLSDLDLEMIDSVPQGGNWKNISQKTVEKSQRLIKITKTGGRTTLYGRIDYEKPSYTITTYFNRPGNGTYVHPVHNRVLSVREAARFQAFPEDYFFVGNKTDILKQVGNAVPSLLAYSIGRNLHDKLNCKTSVDLFAGAGGLSIGLENAGIKSLAVLDNFQSACVTFKVNNPSTPVVCDDITLKQTKNQLYSTVEKQEVDIVCGGPPCQGFSYAGKRFIDDPRNKLFKDFVEIVEKIMPKALILENVPGMLTLSKGAIYNQIISLFDEIGYKVEGRLLLASDYGVPQKRKRLIIIGVRKDYSVEPSDLFPEEITKESPVPSRVVLADLENISCSDNARYLENHSFSDYVKMLSGELSYSEYFESFRINDTPKEHSDMQLQFAGI